MNDDKPTAPGIVTLHLHVEECAALLDVPLPSGHGPEHRSNALLKLKCAIMATPEQEDAK